MCRILKTLSFPKGDHPLIITVPLSMSNFSWWPKKSPAPSLKSSGLPRYNNFGQISWCLKIDHFKLGQIEKIDSFSKRGSLTENNGTITNVQLLMVMEKFNFFKNFKKLLMGGHDEKLKNFGKSRK